MYHRFICLLTAVFACGAISAEDQAPQFAKPGPQHAELKKLEGTWDATMKMAGAPEPMPAVAVYKMELDGMWLVSEFKLDSPGFKFTGKGIDGYDQQKKKFVGIWVDSMSSAPMFMEGDHNPVTKSTTMTGVSTNPDGKPQKFKAVTKMKDDDHMTFEMFMVDADGKETSAFTIDYTRKKSPK